MKKEDFLNVIKSKREELRYSQTEMSEKLGITQSQYGKLESGRSEISLDRFIEVCNTLGLKINDFDNKNSEKKNKEEIIRKMKDLLNDL